MDEITWEGRLVRWNNTQGVGYIESKQLDEDVFIRISTLKHMNRGPRLDDVIYFRTHRNRKGQLCAKDANIYGVSIDVNNVTKLPRRKTPLKQIVRKIVILLIVVGLLYLYGDPLWQYLLEKNQQIINYSKS